MFLHVVLLAFWRGVGERGEVDDEDLAACAEQVVSEFVVVIEFEVVAFADDLAVIGSERFVGDSPHLVPASSFLAVVAE